MLLRDTRNERHGAEAIVYNTIPKKQPKSGTSPSLLRICLARSSFRPFALGKTDNE
jgi:hypothetical protein